MHQCPCCAAADPDSGRLCWLTTVSTQIAREAGLVCTQDIEDITTVAYAGLLDGPGPEGLTQHRLLEVCRQELIIWAWEQGTEGRSLPLDQRPPRGLIR